MVAVTATLGTPIRRAFSRPRPNLERYELRCGDARIPLAEIWKSCKGFQAPGAVDVDMPFTEAEWRRANGETARLSCEVVEIETSTATPGAPGHAASEETNEPREFSQLLRANVFSSTPAESERGCLTTDAVAFKKLVARPGLKLLARLAREATRPVGSMAFAA